MHGGRPVWGEQVDPSLAVGAGAQGVWSFGGGLRKRDCRSNRVWCDLDARIPCGSGFWIVVLNTTFSPLCWQCQHPGLVVTGFPRVCRPKPSTSARRPCSVGRAAITGGGAFITAGSERIRALCCSSTSPNWKPCFIHAAGSRHRHPPDRQSSAGTGRCGSRLCDPCAGPRGYR